MLKLHGRAAALALGGVLAIGLPAGFVLAATSHDVLGVTVSTEARSTSPTGEAHGDAVSTLARGTHGTTDQSSSNDQNGTTNDQNGTANQPTDTHGAAVSAVAKDQTMVGGKNDNHGGAVSAVARGSHGQAPQPPTPNHGSSVSPLASGTSTTGEAHGDAVSSAARGTH